MNRSELLIDTLDSFGISAQVDKIEAGPTVTTYTLKPGRGVRVKDIAALKDDISIALDADVRITKNVIEVPNKQRTIIKLTDMLGSQSNQVSPLSVALGADEHGNNLFIDIAKLPHLLVAGQTGSGKSSCLHNIIVSLLLNSMRHNIELALIDTKRVEFARYRNIDNVVVAGTVGGALERLRDAVRVMRNRYAKLEQYNASTITEYNEKYGNAWGKMKHAVIIIDEFADLMMSTSQEVEALVCKIAQLGRACGIHLVIATQRPSVKVITGQIKANIPARIAFKTASSVDSRVIIDRSGAETLLGAGDGLLVSDGETKRFQGAYISADDMQRCIDRFKIA